MIFNQAYADTTTSTQTQVVTPQQNGAQPNMWSSMLPFVVIFAIFYFLVIRPQRTTEKKRQEALSKLEPGTLIVTNSGIYGKIVAIRDKDMDLEISKNSIIKILRSSIASAVDANAETKK